MTGEYERLRALHKEGYDPDAAAMTKSCDWDNEAWPCATHTILDAYKEAVEALAAHQVIWGLQADPRLGGTECGWSDECNPDSEGSWMNAMTHSETCDWAICQRAIDNARAVLARAIGLEDAVLALPWGTRG